MNEERVKKLLKQYTTTIDELRNIGVIKTGKVIPDYGEFMASKKMGLKLMTSSVNKGYDAVDKKGNKYEIKTRKANLWNKPTIFPVNATQLAVADFLVYIEFDNEWNITKLLKIPCKEVKSNKYNRVIINRALVAKYSILS